MIPRDVKAPTIPIPFHRLLKEVAIVDDKDPQTKELLDQVAAKNFEIEVSDNFNRFPGFNYEVQGVFQERSDGRIKFHTYVVRE